MSNRSSIGRGHNWMIFGVIIMLVAVIVSLVVYLTWLIVRTSKINDMANIHITRGVKDSSEKDLLYENKEYGFRFSYSNAWEAVENGDHAVSLRKFNTKQFGLDSLAAAVFVDVYENYDNLSMEAFLEKNKPETSSRKEALLLDGRDAIKEKSVNEEGNMTWERVCWQDARRVTCIKGIYYNRNSSDLQRSYEKIISSFEFF